MSSLYTTIILPTRPQPDTLVAIYILKKYGQEKFPGIETAKIEIRPTLQSNETEESLANAGCFLIDLGGGKFDHHNKEQKTTASNLISEYLGVREDASLAKLLEYAERDDFYGKGTMSSDPIDKALGLSGLITALNKSLPQEGEKVADYILPLIWAHHAEELRRTEELPQEFAKALESGLAKVFMVKQRAKNLRVVLITSGSGSLPGYLRSQQGGRHDVVAQQIPSGHVNILTRPTKRVDLRSLAALLRLKESGQEYVPQISLWDYAQTGRFEPVPEWYFDPATNSLLNGGLNPKDVPPTKISLNDMRQILEDGLSERIWSPQKR